MTEFSNKERLIILLGLKFRSDSYRRVESASWLLNNFGKVHIVRILTMVVWNSHIRSELGGVIIWRYIKSYPPSHGVVKRTYLQCVVNVCILRRITNTDGVVACRLVWMFQYWENLLASFEVTSNICISNYDNKCVSINSYFILRMNAIAYIIDPLSNSRNVGKFI